MLGRQKSLVAWRSWVGGWWEGEHNLNRTTGEMVDSLMFLDFHINSNLTWPLHNDTDINKALVYFLSECLRRFSMYLMNLLNFYRCARESILTWCMSAWYGNCTNARTVWQPEWWTQPSHHRLVTSLHSIYLNYALLLEGWKDACCPDHFFFSLPPWLKPIAWVNSEAIQLIFHTRNHVNYLAPAVEIDISSKWEAHFK